MILHGICLILLGILAVNLLVLEVFLLDILWQAAHYSCRARLAHRPRVRVEQRHDDVGASTSKAKCASCVASGCRPGGHDAPVVAVLVALSGAVT